MGRKFAVPIEQFCLLTPEMSLKRHIRDDRPREPALVRTKVPVVLPRLNHNASELTLKLAAGNSYDNFQTRLRGIFIRNMKKIEEHVCY
ncbi:hypothetical protein AVEN_207744-1 [Araneus ventricosus]|uniref:Uncharacterized protein n=1 Tax=Araneus ventricosus TaxID=182803 RepID=A0A4Y2J6N4_ARAVE|nr:hypothetical protein AVEN_207744-1 [Araneus ventricosus]